jgi:cytochrome P450
MSRRSLPFLGDLLAFGSDRLGFLQRVASEQGDVASFRLGPYRAWLLTHPDDIQDVLVKHADRFRKGPVLQRARIVLGDGLLTAEGDVHRQHRTMVQPAFHSRRIASYATTMIEQADVATTRWADGVPLDVHAEAVRITLASAGRTLLGATISDDDVATVESALADLLSAYKLAFVPFGWQLQRLPIGPMRRLRRGRTKLYQLVDRVIADRRASGTDAGDLLSALVSPEEGGAHLTDQEIRDQAVTLLLAGHETTANALAFAFYLLASAPEVEAQVHAELDATLDGDLPTPDDAARLPVCRAVVSEALRLYPPAWLMGRQAVADHRVGGHTIAAGDVTLLSQWATHRDPRWWPEPDRFVPERWIDDAWRDRPLARPVPPITPAATPRDRPLARPVPPITPAATPRWAYFPFGAGLRRCIGEGFAWTEGVLALATIASRWTLRPVPDLPVELEPLITLRPRNGVWLRPEPRRSGPRHSGKVGQRGTLRKTRSAD